MLVWVPWPLLMDQLPFPCWRVQGREQPHIVRWDIFAPLLRHTKWSHPMSFQHSGSVLCNSSTLLSRSSLNHNVFSPIFHTYWAQCVHSSLCHLLYYLWIASFDSLLLFPPQTHFSWASQISCREFLFATLLCLMVFLSPWLIPDFKLCILLLSSPDILISPLIFFRIE